MSVTFSLASLARLGTLGVLLVACSTQPSAPAAKPAAATSAPAAPAAPAQPAAATNAPAASASAPLSPPVTVRVGTLPNVSDSGNFIAIEKGYFTEEGINIERVPFDSAGPQVAPLGAGQLDVGGGSTSAGLYNAIARDVPLKIVADRGSMPPGSPWIALLVRRDLSDQIRDYSDLRGRKIGINQFGTTNDVAIDTALKRGGLVWDDADIVQIPYSDMNAALSTRNIDVAQHNEPFKAQAIEQGLATFFHGVDEYYPNMQFSVVIFGPHFADRPEVARRWMVAYLRGVRDYNDAMYKGINKPAIVELIMQHVPLRDPSLFDKMAITALNPDGKLNIQGMKDDLRWFVEHGLTTQAPDMDKVIDTSFAEYALSRLGSYQR